MTARCRNSYGYGNIDLACWLQHRSICLVSFFTFNQSWH